jgi:hypothetical protein
MSFGTNNDDPEQTVNDSIFGRHMRHFLTVMLPDEAMDGIPEEYREQILQLMALSAFHVSLAARVYMLHALKFGGPDSSMMKEIVLDTDELFETIGLSLSEILEATNNIAPANNSSHMLC